MGQECGKSGARVGQEWGKSGARVGQEWGESGARVGREWSKSAARVGQEWGKSAARVGQECGKSAARVGQEWGKSVPVAHQAPLERIGLQSTNPRVFTEERLLGHRKTQITSKKKKRAHLKARKFTKSRHAHTK